VATIPPSTSTGSTGWATTGRCNGLTFDTSGTPFTADYYLGITNGGTPYELDVNYAQLRDVASVGDPGVGYYAGKGTAGEQRRPQPAPTPARR